MRTGFWLGSPWPPWGESEEGGGNIVGELGLRNMISSAHRKRVDGRLRLKSCRLDSVSGVTACEGPVRDKWQAALAVMTLTVLPSELMASHSLRMEMSWSRAGGTTDRDWQASKL